MEANKDMLIIDLLKLDEGIARILMNEGMHCVGCMAAHGESLGQACLVHDIDPDKLVEKINKYLGDK